MVILYAEDDIEDFNLFCAIVGSIDPSARVINARDGAEALETLEAMVVLPDYVFLDINMPTMDGKSCLKSIKKDERFRDIPVIIYSTSSNKKDIDLCLQLGAKAYIKKPNSVKDAIDMLSEILIGKKSD